MATWSQALACDEDQDEQGQDRTTGGEKCPTWRGGSSLYFKAHARVREERGSASLFRCVDGCGRMAAEWSYLGGAPDEQRIDGGLAFSDDPAWYAPRCHEDHKRYDATRRKEAAA